MNRKISTIKRKTLNKKGHGMSLGWWIWAKYNETNARNVTVNPIFCAPTKKERKTSTCKKSTGRNSNGSIAIKYYFNIPKILVNKLYSIKTVHERKYQKKFSEEWEITQLTIIRHQPKWLGTINIFKILLRYRSVSVTSVGCGENKRFLLKNFLMKIAVNVMQKKKVRDFTA